MEELNEIKNIGPYMVNILNKIGIFSKEDLMATDYKTIKKNLESIGILPHLNIFYSIEMGLQNRRWTEILQDEKREIRKILS